MAGILSIETHSGKAVRLRGVTIIPFAQAVQIKLPGLPGGLVWNRPQSVLVVDSAGNERTLPIQDVTRWITWSLLGAAGLMAVIYWVTGQNRKE